jgi:hypothetical protein
MDRDDGRRDGGEGWDGLLMEEFPSATWGWHPIVEC